MHGLPHSPIAATVTAAYDLHGHRAKLKAAVGRHHIITAASRPRYRDGRKRKPGSSAVPRAGDLV